MCSVLKDPVIEDVIRRMDENAEMVMLNNASLTEILNPVITMIDALDATESIFKGVESVSVAGASGTFIRTIETPTEFSDYVFD